MLSCGTRLTLELFAMVTPIHNYATAEEAYNFSKDLENVVNRLRPFPKAHDPCHPVSSYSYSQELGWLVISRLPPSVLVTDEPVKKGLEAVHVFVDAMNSFRATVDRARVDGRRVRAIVCKTIGKRKRQEEPSKDLVVEVWPGLVSQDTDQNANGQRDQLQGMLMDRVSDSQNKWVLKSNEVAASAWLQKQSFDILGVRFVIDVQDLLHGARGHVYHPLNCHFAPLVPVSWPLNLSGQLLIPAPRRLLHPAATPVNPTADRVFLEASVKHGMRHEYRGCSSP